MKQYLKRTNARTLIKFSHFILIHQRYGGHKWFLITIGWYIYIFSSLTRLGQMKQFDWKHLCKVIHWVFLYHFNQIKTWPKWMSLVSDWLINKKISWNPLAEWYNIWQETSMGDSLLYYYYIFGHLMFVSDCPMWDEQYRLSIPNL